MLQKEQMGDKAGKQYWDNLWAGQEVPDPINPRLWGLKHYVSRRFDTFFRQIFSRFKGEDKTLLEIGCARSAWLPYFAREFGFTISGLDYSETGCEQARQVLSKAGVEGNIVFSDLFSPPQELRGAFDVVVSFGVVEHFNDTVACAAALGEFLKPGGIVITIIPNMRGFIGSLIKMLNPANYEIHVPLSCHQLHVAHETAGLRIVQCRYFLSTSFGTASLVGLDEGSLSTRIKRFILLSLKCLSRLVWVLESRTRPLPAVEPFAPYVVCVAQKLG